MRTILLRRPCENVTPFLHLYAEGFDSVVERETRFKYYILLLCYAPPDLNLVQALPVDPGLPAAPLLSARPCIALGLLCVFGNGNFYGSAWPIFQIDSESQWE